MLAITNVRLIDGTGADPADKTTTIIGSNGIIAAVGPAESIDAPPGVRTVNGDGLTLLPGLIDCHDHLAMQGYDLAGRWGLDEPASLRTLRVAQTIEDTLQSGYTTVRDAGWLDAGFKYAVEEGIIDGPRLLVAASPISPTGGLADRRSPSWHRPLLGDNPGLPMLVADGPDEVRRCVREAVRVGADVIKFATTGGASSWPGHGPKDVEFGRDEIRALVQEAKAHGKRTMCHALGGPGLRMAVEEGANSIEHGSYLDQDPDLFKLMADQGTFFVPTLTVYVYHRTQGTPHGRERAEHLQPHHTESIQLALKAGVKVVGGTDAGGWLHGNNAQELELLGAAGMSPMQVIQAATGWAAECLGIDKESGTVQPGKAADLLLIEGDPLKDVAILQDRSKIKMVMKAGKVYADNLSD